MPTLPPIGGGGGSNSGAVVGVPVGLGLVVAGVVAMVV